MAMTPTVLGLTSAATLGATIASPSVSPTANSLLVAVVFGGTGSIAAPAAPVTLADTLSGGSLSWTGYQTDNWDGTTEAIIAMFVAKAGATPGSGVITGTYTGGNLNRRHIVIVEVPSGFDMTTPVTQSDVATGAAGTTLSDNLGSTPATDSLVIAAVCARLGTTVTPGAAYTELDDTSPGSNLACQIQYDNASAATLYDWSALGSGGTKAGVAIEIKAAAGGKAFPFRAQALRIWKIGR